MTANLPENQDDESIDNSPFCSCSGMHFQEILELQREDPVPFLELIVTHASCGVGCGSCIDDLKAYLMAHGAYVED